MRRVVKADMANTGFAACSPMALYETFMRSLVPAAPSWMLVRHAFLTLP